MDTSGKFSEWNEATLKVIRLHEIQSTINMLKMDPLGITNGKFNYVWLANNVDTLYGEGYSKYSKTERKEVDRLRKLTFDCLKFMPPHKVNNQEGMGNSKKTYVLNKENFDRFMDILELFVRRVKDLNDEHGLTTKNRNETEGLFG